MSISAEVFEQVRERANYACEYCGVTESEARSLLTIDHYQPQAHDGSDDPVNLVYACFRCNGHKADYWPTSAEATPLWNPRMEPAANHFLEAYDGQLFPLTNTGRETIRRLRLNRPPLVQARVRNRLLQMQTVWIERLTEITAQLIRVQSNRSDSSAEEYTLLDEQRRILEALREIER